MALFAVVASVAGTRVVRMAAEENSVMPMPPGIEDKTPSKIPADNVTAKMGRVAGMPKATTTK